ncbi:hypothetical protein CPC08DRAFT_717644 [Agrocybe pediades]|nr:hypothetical protein CPC08DRAFT_717644 [Agrocybe pediades]
MVARLVTSSHNADSINDEPTSLVSLPQELGDQPNPAQPSIGAVPVELVRDFHSAREEVNQDGAAIVAEARDRHRDGQDEENCV